MKERLNVWLVKEGEALPSDKGEQRLLRMGLIAEELIKEGHNVLWWASTFNHNLKTYRANEPVELEINDRYHIQLVHGRKYSKNLSIGRLLHFIDERKQFERIAEGKNKPDIILASMPNIDLAYAAVRYGKKKNVPVVIDVRDLWPDLYEDYFPRFKKLVHIAIIPIKRQLSYTLKNATAIYATSEKFLDWALNYAQRKKRNYDNYYYVSYPDSKDIKLTNEDYAYWSKMGLSSKDLICCFFGQFGNAVNLEPIMHASVLLKDSNPEIKFVICGMGEKIDIYKGIIGDSPNVFFPGWVDKKQICALGTISSIGLLAYRKNKNFEWSMPNKFCEYLSLGLYLMVEPEGMMSDLSERYKCGYRYSSTEDLCNHLKHLSINRGKVLQSKKNSRNLYERFFKADEVYSKLVNDLTKISMEVNNEV